MLKPWQLLLAIASAVCCAVLVRQFVAAPTPAIPDAPRSSIVTRSGRGPAFHLDLDARGRLIEARRSLDKLTSGEAIALGAIKDDLALLAADDAVREMVLRDFDARAHINSYEGEGFANLFELIRHKDFVPRVARLFGHEEFSVRQAAVRAALTQADPELGAPLYRFQQELERDYPSQGMNTRLAVLDAAHAIGGDFAPLIAAFGLADPMPSVRAAAAEFAAIAKMQSLGPQIAQRLPEEGPDARVIMARALVALDSPIGWREIYDLLDVRIPGQALECLEAIIEHAPLDARSHLDRGFESAPSDLKKLHALAYARIGAQDVLDRLALSAQPEDKLLWLIALAARGRPEDLPALLKVVQSGEDAVAISCIAFGLQYAKPKADFGLARALIESGRFKSTVELGTFSTSLGDQALPWLIERLNQAHTLEAAVFAIDLLASQDSDGARAALLVARRSPPPGQADPQRFVELLDQRLRLFDLARLRRGQMHRWSDG